jgi:hypothetical protein
VDRTATEPQAGLKRSFLMGFEPEGG